MQLDYYDVLLHRAHTTSSWMRHNDHVFYSISAKIYARTRLLTHRRNKLGCTTLSWLLRTKWASTAKRKCFSCPLRRAQRIRILSWIEELTDISFSCATFQFAWLWRRKKNQRDWIHKICHCECSLVYQSFKLDPVNSIYAFHCVLFSVSAFPNTSTFKLIRRNRKFVLAVWWIFLAVLSTHPQMIRWDNEHLGASLIYTSFQPDRRSKQLKSSPKIDLFTVHGGFLHSTAVGTYTRHGRKLHRQFLSKEWMNVPFFFSILFLVVGRMLFRWFIVHFHMTQITGRILSSKRVYWTVNG